MKDDCTVLINVKNFVENEEVARANQIRQH